MYIMCLIIFEEKAEIQDQYPLSLNPVQKPDDPESGSLQKYWANNIFRKRINLSYETISVGFGQKFRRFEASVFSIYWLCIFVHFIFWLFCFP